MNLLLIITSTLLASEPKDIRYEEALESALARNPTLIGARLDVDAADGALIAAKGIYDPTLSAGTSQNQFTSESTREFGEVLSEFESMNWRTGLNQTCRIDRLYTRSLLFNS